MSSWDSKLRLVNEFVIKSLALYEGCLLLLINIEESEPFPMTITGCEAMVDQSSLPRAETASQVSIPSSNHFIRSTVVTNNDIAFGIIV